jgi:hypothetical protein
MKRIYLSGPMTGLLQKTKPQSGGLPGANLLLE